MFSGGFNHPFSRVVQLRRADGLVEWVRRTMGLIDLNSRASDKRERCWRVECRFAVPRHTI